MIEIAARLHLGTEKLISGSNLIRTLYTDHKRYHSFTSSIAKASRTGDVPLYVTLSVAIAVLENRELYILYSKRVCLSPPAPKISPVFTIRRTRGSRSPRHDFHIHTKSYMGLQLKLFLLCMCRLFLVHFDRHQVSRLSWIPCNFLHQERMLDEADLHLRSGEERDLSLLQS